MALERFEKNMGIIQQLPDEPNDVGGLSSAELKAKFDEGGEALKEYINEVLLPGIEDAGLAETIKSASLEQLKVMRIDGNSLQISPDGVSWVTIGFTEDGAKFDGKANLVDGKIPVEELPVIKAENVSVSAETGKTVFGDEEAHTAEQVMAKGAEMYEHWWSAKSNAPASAVEYTEVKTPVTDNPSIIQHNTRTIYYSKEVFVNQTTGSVGLLNPSSISINHNGTNGIEALLALAPVYISNLYDSDEKTDPDYTRMVYYLPAGSTLGTTTDATVRSAYDDEGGSYRFYLYSSTVGDVKASLVTGEKRTAENPAGDISYVHSIDRDAYPDGEKDGVIYSYLGKPFENAKAGTPRVGDIQTTIRTDLGEDWLLCNGEMYDTGEYPELAVIRPMDVMVKSNSVKDKPYHAYYNGYYYSVGRSANFLQKDPIVVTIYRKRKVLDDWQIYYEYNLAHYTASTSINMRISYALDGHYLWVILTWSSYRYAMKVDLDDATQSTYRYGGGFTQSINSESKTTAHAVAYNNANGKWYVGYYNNTNETYQIHEYDDIMNTAFTAYNIPTADFNDSYQRGFTTIRCTNGCVYGEIYNRYGFYLFAFTDPNNIAVVERSASSSGSASAYVYYSDKLGTAYGVVSLNTTSTSSGNGYVYRNGKWEVQLYPLNSYTVIKDMFEHNGEYYICVSSAIYESTDILSSAGLVASGSTSMTGSYSSQLARGGPAFFIGDNTQSYLYNATTPVVTTDNAYNYIKGR